MKLKSLFLGSVAAAGLSTAGFAADLGVLTSLDVCDSLGISGLTISSSDNCLQITGGVSYEFAYGDYRTEATAAATFDGTRNIPISNSGPDWSSKVEAWLEASGTASSDFGRARAVIRIKEIDQTRVTGGFAGNGLDRGDDTGGIVLDRGYVQVGDTTTLIAGKTASIADLSDDAPFNSFLGLFTSDAIDGKGVGVDGDTTYLGGHVIQVVSEVADGFKVGVALENINGHSELFNGALPGLTGDDLAANAPLTHGSLVGVVAYSGNGLTAHVTGAALGVLDGIVESWFVHAGATASFDAFKVRGAVAYWDNFKFGENIASAPFAAVGGADVLNALVSAEGTFDLFTLSASAEVANVQRNNASDYTDYGVGGQVGFGITEGVSINLGARYFHQDLTDLDTTQVAVQVVAAVTETIKATGEIGGYFGSAIANNSRTVNAAGTAPTGFRNDEVYYGAAELAWAPGGGFSSSLRGELNSEDSYKVTFKAAKEFK